MFSRLVFFKTQSSVSPPVVLFFPPQNWAPAFSGVTIWQFHRSVLRTTCLVIIIIFGHGALSRWVILRSSPNCSWIIAGSSCSRRTSWSLSLLAASDLGQELGGDPSQGSYALLMEKAGDWLSGLSCSGFFLLFFKWKIYKVENWFPADISIVGRLWLYKLDNEAGEEVRNGWKEVKKG